MVSKLTLSGFLTLSTTLDEVKLQFNMPPAIIIFLVLTTFFQEIRHSLL